MAGPVEIDIGHLRTWIGREERVDDIAHAGALAGLAALLDRDRPFDAVPPLGHWLYCLPRVPGSQIGADGHAALGTGLPPVPLPRRMWAGSRVSFRAPIAIGDALQRRSVVTDVAFKSGRSGPLVFVTVEHDIRANGVPAVVEEQELVYRSGEPGPPPAIQPAPQADAERILTLDPVQLFRFSALTFNGHRIHYDRDYARDVEGYPGLVVHGPLLATLLLHEFLDARPGAVVSRFSFRGMKPQFDGPPFALCLKAQGRGASLWARDLQGGKIMQADVAAEE